MGKISKNELSESLKLEIGNAGAEIVNDFSGGVDKVASAELAKTLNTNQQTTNSQLAQDAQNLKSHKEEIIQHSVNFIRSANLTGIQTVNLLPNKTPKAIFATAIVNNTNKVSIGNNSGGYHRQSDIDVSTGTSALIGIADTNSNKTFGIIKTIGKGGIDIEWSHIGTGATGNIVVRLLILYHGED